MKRYVQYGCGFSVAPEWINYDASPTLRFERIPVLGKLYSRNGQRFPEIAIYGDIVKGLPEKPDSCDAVFCSHVLEHLTYDDFIKAIKNTYTILKPGGIFRGVLPDLKAAILYYIKTYDDLESPASDFIRSTSLGVEKQEGKLVSFFGNSKHLWMWDYKSLEFELKQVGFKNIRPCSMGDSADPHFSYVEEESRFENAAAFECTK